MPFKSEKQRKYLWAKHPDVARRWTKEYGSEPVKKAFDRESYKRGLETGTAAGLGFVGTKVVVDAAQKVLEKPTATPIDAKTIQKLEDHMGIKPGSVKYEFSKKLPSEAWLGSKGHQVRVPPKGVEYLAHELGHVKKAPQSLKGILLQRELYTKGLGAGLIAAGVLAAGKDPDSLRVKLAPAAVALGAAPLLIEEGRASAAAAKALTHIGLGVKELARARKNLLFAFGARAAPALAGITGAHLVGKARRAKAEK